MQHATEAANMLQDLVEKGEVELNEDHTVSIVRVPNIVMNQDQVS